MDLEILINQLSSMQSKAYAYDQQSLYAQRAHEYCNKYIPNGLGRNVWIAILEDAIALRDKLARESGK